MEPLPVAAARTTRTTTAKPDLVQESVPRSPRKAMQFVARMRSLTSSPESPNSSCTQEHDEGRILGLCADSEAGPSHSGLLHLLRLLPLWLCCGHAKAKDLSSFRLSEPERRAAKECLQRARQAGDGDKPSMCFMRQDILSGKWAHFQLGTGNAKKPRQTESKSKQVQMRPIHEEPDQLKGCPFCALHPPEAADVLRFEELKNGEAEYDSMWQALKDHFWYAEDTFAGHRLRRDWSRPDPSRPAQVRVVRNIFPSMSVPREYYDDDYDGGFLEDMTGNMINPAVEHPLYLQVPGVGFNDVVIETPWHNMCAALEREEYIALTLRAIVIRGRELMQNPLVRYVSVFKQHKCGSIVHAHWQIITTPFVPSSVDVQLIRAARLHRRFNACIGCQVLVTAPTGSDLASERLVLETKHFVVSAPFACRERWRLYLAPKRHSPDFFATTEDELVDLAHVLKRVLQMYYHKLDDCPFNIAVWTRPTVVKDDSWLRAFRWNSGPDDCRHFHWHIGFYPRGKPTPQGFKNATDIAPMKTLPEDDAAIMRQWLTELQ
ncbi:unnamed protein product [Symbiodinium natans]|uniref:Galactose-1-phosphate uridylyltransferase n=1 Tax=Symbiodinium natans TaxID=878477 RepID=A0A812UBK2_9DINO|nr:unnamed protein product [Symbiodinium natans]